MAGVDDGPPARIDVLHDEDERWVWTYRSGDVELTSNRSFAEQHEALASARRAFHGVPRSHIHLQEPQVERSKVRLRLQEVAVGLAVILLALRNRRR